MEKHNININRESLAKAVKESQSRFTQDKESIKEQVMDTLEQAIKKDVIENRTVITHRCIGKKNEIGINTEFVEIDIHQDRRTI